MTVRDSAGKRRCGRIHPANVLALLLFSAFFFCSSALTSQSTQEPKPPEIANGQSVIIVRDGTPIHLPFAQRLCGGGEAELHIASEESGKCQG